MTLFVVPSIVMGMVSSFAVRLEARAVGMVGQTAGNLYAISTVGSIIGTLAGSFVLLNYMGVRMIILALGLTLMLMAALGLLAWRQPAPAVASAVLIAFMVVGVARAQPAGRSSVIHARDTVYHTITVQDVRHFRYLKLDNRFQSGLNLNHPRRTVLPYTDYMHLPLVFVPEPKRTTLIGLGGGTVPTRYVADYPSIVADAVQIDPHVIEVVRRYFAVRESERLTLTARDGRLHLRSTTTPQDILMDAYLPDGIPFHLATREFFQLIRAKLAPGGLMAINIIAALDGPESRLFRAIYKTIRAVFPTVYVFSVGLGPKGSVEAVGNIIVIATGELPSPRPRS